MILNKKTYIFDIETNGLNPDKIWVTSASVFNKEDEPTKVFSTTNYDDMIKFFSREDIILVGHNITLYDIPVIEKILEINPKAEIIDTLILSWYLYPNRGSHGLEKWGESLGVEKPKITDWDNLTIEDYTHRCEEDVKINHKLFNKMWDMLMSLYGTEEAVMKCVRYLTFKMKCARMAEKSGWRLDVDRCKKALVELEAERDDKINKLKEAMPKVIKYKSITKPNTLYKNPKKVNKPKNLYKKNGELSAAGLKWEALTKELKVPFNSANVLVESKELTVRGREWLELLEANKLPLDFNGEITIEVSREEPNPASNPQIKDWLTSLGWKPKEFNESTLKDGSKSLNPKVRVDTKDGKQLCKSVLELKEVEPAISELEGLSILNHRIPLLKGFLKNCDDSGFIKAQIQGLTNTWRFQHKTVVNLPNVKKPYGELIRGVLIASDENHELCGSDMSSLEDRTKLHYMWKFDPDYVKEMMSDDFDPHLSIAVSAGFITEEELEFYKWYNNK